MVCPWAHATFRGESGQLLSAILNLHYFLYGSFYFREMVRKGNSLSASILQNEVTCFRDILQNVPLAMPLHMPQQQPIESKLKQMLRLGG